MADSERCEIFALVPLSQAGNSSITFILPDSSPNFQSVAVRDRDAGYSVRPKCSQSGGYHCKCQASAVESMAKLFS